MKRYFSILMVVCVILNIAMPIVFALSETPTYSDSLPYEDNNNMNITVMMPEPAPDAESELELTSEQAKQKPVMYPSEVNEFTNESGRQIVKTYILLEGENPDCISRDSFVRDGFSYELTDITRKEIFSTSTQDHVDTVYTAYFIGKQIDYEPQNDTAQSKILQTEAEQIGMLKGYKKEALYALVLTVICCGAYYFMRKIRAKK